MFTTLPGGAEEVKASPGVPHARKKSALDFLNIDGVRFGQPYSVLGADCKV
jgi:hypothetical protein